MYSDLQELDDVVLLHDLETPDGVVPRGAHGTVLIVYRYGVAFAVAFVGHDCPETVLVGNLERLHPPAGSRS